MADKTITELPVASAIGITDVSVLVSNNVDYQFDFALLLQFISANISTGAAITFGTVIPQNNSGKNGDVFFKTDIPAFYQKTNDTWAQVYTPAASTNSSGRGRRIQTRPRATAPPQPWRGKALQPPGPLPARPSPRARRAGAC